MNRLIATLDHRGCSWSASVALIVLTAPIIVRELAYFIENFPLYVRQLQGLETDPNRPWLSKIIGEGLGHAEQSIGELTTLAIELARHFPAFDVVRRPRIDLGLLPAGGNPDPCLLPHLRLER